MSDQQTPPDSGENRPDQRWQTSGRFEPSEETQVGSSSRPGSAKYATAALGLSIVAAVLSLALLVRIFVVVLFADGPADVRAWVTDLLPFAAGAGVVLGVIAMILANWARPRRTMADVEVESAEPPMSQGQVRVARRTRATNVIAWLAIVAGVVSLWRMGDAQELFRQGDALVDQHDEQLREQTERLEELNEQMRESPLLD